MRKSTRLRQVPVARDISMDSGASASETHRICAEAWVRARCAPAPASTSAACSTARCSGRGCGGGPAWRELKGRTLGLRQGFRRPPPPPRRRHQPSSRRRQQLRPLLAHPRELEARPEGPRRPSNRLRKTRQHTAGPQREGACEVECSGRSESHITRTNSAERRRLTRSNREFTVRRPKR